MGILNQGHWCTLSRCILYWYSFLDLLLQWIPTGNGWTWGNLFAWSPKMSDFLNMNDRNNKRICCYARGCCWSSSINANWRKTTYQWRNPTNRDKFAFKFAKSESATRMQRLRSSTQPILHINNQLLCSNVETEVGQIYDAMRRSFEMF